MPVVVSLLEEPAAGRLRALWEGIEREFGLPEPVAPPHLTLHSAEAYDVERVAQMLKSLARTLPPFATRCEGVGLFPGSPVTLYLPVVRTPRLTLLHRNLVDEVRDHAQEPSGYYQPDRWLPHLTVAQGALAGERLAAMLGWLLRQELSWEVAVTNLALVDGEGAAVICRYELVG